MAPTCFTAYKVRVTDRLHPTGFARQLRGDATEAERALWRVLGRLRPRFTRQYPVGRYIADFACRRARLIVEVDGGQHCDSEYDIRRSADFAAAGWRVLRYWNDDVLANGEGVVVDIISRASARLPPGEAFESVSPRPARRREGSKGHPLPPPASAGGEK